MNDTIDAVGMATSMTLSANYASSVIIVLPLVEASTICKFTERCKLTVE